MISDWGPEHWRAAHSARFTQAMRQLPPGPPLCHAEARGTAAVTKIPHSEALPGSAWGCAGHDPIPALISPAFGWAEETQHDERLQTAREAGAQGFKAQLPPGSAGMRYFCSAPSGLQKCFLPFFKRKNLLFNCSVFSLLCGEEQLCSDLCLSLAKDSYHPELQHQGSHGKLLKGNTALLKPWNMLRRKQVTFATSISSVSCLPCKGGNSVGTGSCVCVPISKTATLQMPQRHFSGAVTML